MNSKLFKFDQLHMSNQVVKTSVNLPLEVSNEADIVCREIGMARNAFVCLAVREYIANYKREKLALIEVEEKLKKANSLQLAA